jgi:hypothetical protein
MPPARWLVTLLDGSIVEVYAHAVTGLSANDDDRDHVFGCLMDIDVAEQREFEILATSPNRPERIEVVVARFPKQAVMDIESG